MNNRQHLRAPPFDRNTTMPLFFPMAYLPTRVSPHIPSHTHPLAHRHFQYRSAAHASPSFHQLVLFSPHLTVVDSTCRSPPNYLSFLSTTQSQRDYHTRSIPYDAFPTSNLNPRIRTHLSTTLPSSPRLANRSIDADAPADTVQCFPSVR